MKIDLKIIKEQNFVLKAPPYDLTKWALPSELEDDSSKSPEAAEQVPVPIDTPAGEKVDGPVKPEEDNILEKATAAAKNLLDATLGDSGGTEGAAGEAGEVPIDLSNCNDNMLSYLFGVVAGSGTGASARIGSTALRNVAKSVFERDLRRMIDFEFPSSGNSTLKKVAKSMKNPWVGIPVALAVGATSLAAAQGSDSNNEDIKTLSQAVNYFKEGKWADGISEAGGVTDCFWVAYTIGLLGGVGLYGGAAAGIRSSADIVSTGLAASARGVVATAKGAAYLASKTTSGAIGASQSALAGLDFMGRLVVSPGVLRTIRSSSIEKFKDGLQLDLVKILQAIRRDSSISLQMPRSLNYDLFDIEQLREIVKYQKDNLGTYQFVIRTERLNGIVQAVKDAAIERARILRDEIDELESQITKLGPGETAVGMGKDIIPKRLEYEKLQDIVTDDRLTAEYQRALSLMVGQLNEKYVRVLSQHALTMAKQSNFQSIKDMEEFLKIIRSPSIQKRVGSRPTSNEAFVYKIFNEHTNDLEYLAETFIEESRQFTANNSLGPMKWRRVQSALDKLPRDATPEQIKLIAKKLKLKGINAADDLVELHLSRTLMLSDLDEVDGLWQLSKNKKIVFNEKDKQRLSAQELLLDDEKFIARALRAGRKVASALGYESGAPVANYLGLSKGASTSASVGIKSTGLSGALDSVTASGTFLGAVGLAAATGIKAADSLSGDEGGVEGSKAPVTQGLSVNDVLVIGDSNAVNMPVPKERKIAKSGAQTDAVYNIVRSQIDDKIDSLKPTAAIIHMGYNGPNSALKGIKETISLLKDKGISDIRIINVKVSGNEYVSPTAEKAYIKSINNLKKQISELEGVAIIDNNSDNNVKGDKFHFTTDGYKELLKNALSGSTVATVDKNTNLSTNREQINDGRAIDIKDLKVNYTIKDKQGRSKSYSPSIYDYVIKKIPGIESEEDWNSYRNSISFMETGAYPKPYNARRNGSEYIGKYQIGALGRKDATNKFDIDVDKDNFISNAEVQEQVFAMITKKNHDYLNEYSDTYKTLNPKDKLKAIARAHNGGWSHSKYWLRLEKKKPGLGRIVTDGAGTPIDNFARRLFDESPIGEKYNHKVPEDERITPGTKTKDRGKRIQKALQSKTLQKEVKQMSKKDLRQIVSEVLNENSGQGYAAYPYGSSVRDDEEPKEDYIEEWKALSMEVIRDESRNTAIEIAKILVKDLELFEDVLDLAGQNQSIGTEILTKLKQIKEKA